MAAAGDLKSLSFGSAGSSPARGTKLRVVYGAQLLSTK